MADEELQAPLIQTLRFPAAAVAQASDLTSPAGLVPISGSVSAVRYIPTSVLTGADTNSRTCSLYNRGAAGAGSTLVAQKAFVSGTDAPANDATDITLSGTAANLLVAAGDVLDWESLHIASGLADPGGIVEIDITRG